MPFKRNNPGCPCCGQTEGPRCPTPDTSRPVLFTITAGGDYFVTDLALTYDSGLGAWVGSSSFYDFPALRCTVPEPFIFPGQVRVHYAFKPKDAAAQTYWLQSAYWYCYDGVFTFGPADNSAAPAGPPWTATEDGLLLGVSPCISLPLTFPISQQGWLDNYYTMSCALITNPDWIAAQLISGDRGSVCEATNGGVYISHVRQ